MPFSRGDGHVCKLRRLVDVLYCDVTLGLQSKRSQRWEPLQAVFRDHNLCIRVTPNFSGSGYVQTSRKSVQSCKPCKAGVRIRKAERSHPSTASDAALPLPFQNGLGRTQARLRARRPASRWCTVATRLGRCQFALHRAGLSTGNRDRLAPGDGFSRDFQDAEGRCGQQVG